MAGYWALVKRRKLLVLTGAVLGALVAFVVLVLQDPVYQAAATLEISGINEGFMNMGAADPEANGAFSTTPTNINTQIHIIESGSVRGPAMDRLRREMTPVLPPANGLLAPLRAKLRGGPEDPMQELRRGLFVAALTLKAKVILNTRIISISADSTVPEIASNFVNAITAEYVSQNSQQRAISSQRTSQWLETQIEETRAKLEQSAAKMQSFMRNSGLTYVGRDEESLASTKLRQLQSDLAGMQGERIRLQAQYEQIKSSPPDKLPMVIQDPVFRDSEGKLNDLKQQLAQLSQTLTPAHYKVQRVQQQIDDLTVALEKDKQSILDRSRTDYEEALRRERLLMKNYQGAAGAVSAQADKAAQYQTLKREVDLYQQTLNMMLAQANQTAVVSAVPANNVRVIDAAFVPGVPYKPNGISYEIYGIAGGIVAGIGLAFLIEGIAKWRRSITFGSPGYSARLLNVPELGVIPSIAVQRRLEGLPSRRKWLPSRGEKEPEQLVMSTEQPSLVAESFRLTLTSILLMSRRGMHPKVIVVTSPGPGEGKTTVASNMAIATAESGRRVLVIDADLRKPRIHSIFGVENGEGFADAIGKNRLNGAPKINPTVSESNVPGVFVMTAGSTEGRKLSQIFHAAEIPALLNKLMGQFDVVLIDTPPMLQFSDARLMARYADGVILVVRSGVTDRESAVAAREQLAQDHIEVLGTVLNDWDARGAEANNFSSYYKAYLQYQKAAEAGQ